MTDVNGKCCKTAKFLQLLWNKTRLFLGQWQESFCLHSAEDQREGLKKVKKSCHTDDSVAVTNFYTVTRGQLPRLEALSILVG